MQRPITLILITAICFNYAIAQPTNNITSAERKFNEVKEYFINKQFALAYPLLKELKQQYPANQKSNHTYINDDVEYYYTASGLMLQQPQAEIEAKDFVAHTTNIARRDLMYFYMGKYYFANNDFANTIESYRMAGLENLNVAEKADVKFQLGYCYFNLKKFNEAKPFFEEIHTVTDSKYYIPSNYYYGFISYYNRNYKEALEAFRLVESHEDYKAVVPYYVAEILYFQKNKDEALQYAESTLEKGGLYYEKEMKQLTGQIYFERKEFSKALPRLEYYYKNSSKVTKENLYELSYCYYQTGQIANAINGFKQLSNESDSLGQNSMYLLADCYLKTGEKENARNAFQFCAGNSSNKVQQEISKFNYGKLSYELGYQDIALKELKKFVSEYDKSVYLGETKEILVQLLSNTNNFAEALSLYNSFDKPTATMQRAYPKILYGRAIELINEQQLSQADELLTKALQLPASSITPNANFWKGELNFQQGKYDDAIRNYMSYLQSGNSSQNEVNPTAAKYALGYAWLKKDMYKQALGYFEQVANTIKPTSTTMEQDAYVRASDCYFMLKDFAKADGMYQAIINAASPQSDYAMFQRALIAGVKSSDDKIKTLAALTRAYPNSSLAAEANMEIANTYMSDEKFNDAIIYLNNILANKNAASLYPKAYLKMGLSYYNLNRNNDALTNYKTLIQQYPLSPEADEGIENIKAIYIEENRPNEFVELMRKNGKPIAVSEADSLTYTAAELKYTNNDCNGAINGFNNYLTQYPTGYFALQANFYLGECYSKLKDWKGALKGYDFVVSKGLNKFYERSALYAARINYFELKDYPNAKKYFDNVLSATSNADNQLEALRGLVRCLYQLKQYDQANTVAKDLLSKKGINNDDKAVSNLVLGKSQQTAALYEAAIISLKACAALNKSAWGAEARYEIAACNFSLNQLFNAEKAALSVIKETGSYDLWVTKAYIMLGDIYYAKKDYFNAKATYQSVADNAIIPELKAEAKSKADKVIAEEAANSKLN